MKDLTDILLNYVCPSAGVLMSTLLYAAPVRDLRRALRTGRLGPLNTTPWTVMMGNTVVSMVPYIRSIVPFNHIYGVHESMAYDGFSLSLSLSLSLFFALVPFILLDPRLDGSVDRMTFEFSPKIPGMVSYP